MAELCEKKYLIACCGFCSYIWKINRETEIGKCRSLELNQIHRGTPRNLEDWTQADIARITSMDRLTQDEQTGVGAVAQMYKVVQGKTELRTEVHEASYKRSSYIK